RRPSSSRSRKCCSCAPAAASTPSRAAPSGDSRPVSALLSDRSAEERDQPRATQMLGGGVGTGGRDQDLAFLVLRQLVDEGVELLRTGRPREQPVALRVHAAGLPQSPALRGAALEVDV